MPGVRFLCQALKAKAPSGRRGPQKVARRSISSQDVVATTGRLNTEVGHGGKSTQKVRFNLMFGPTEAPPVADRLESGAVRHGRPSEDDIAVIVADGRVRDMLANSHLTALQLALGRNNVTKRQLARIFGVPLFLVEHAERQLSAREQLALIATVDAVMPHVHKGAEILKSSLPLGTR